MKMAIRTRRAIRLFGPRLHRLRLALRHRAMEKRSVDVFTIERNVAK